MLKITFFALLFSVSTCFAQVREIAITIDDLPLVASKMNTPGNRARASERFMNIIKALQDNQVPATGFVIGGAIIKGQWEFIEAFRNAGFEIGNHTYSHKNLNHMNVDKYISDVDKADRKLEPLLTSPKYFRFPYLAEGRTDGDRAKMASYLSEHGYTVAPVTIDSKDYEFNEQLYHIPYRQRMAHLNQLKKRYLAFIWKQTLRAEKRTKDGESGKQILLIHANLLNSYALDDIIQMYKNKGYTFISLTEALKNPAPSLNVLSH